MTQDQLRVALESAVGVPEQALRDAVANPADIAPAVIAAAQRMADGRLPMLPEANLLRFGLHALSVARHTAACPALLSLLHSPPLEVDWLFGEDRPDYLPQLLLGLFDGDDAALCALAGDKTVDSDARGAALSALSRLVWEGRASRDAVVDVLDRIDRDGEENQENSMWFGWQEAIMLLGLTDWIERVQRAVDAGREVPMFDREVDRKDWLERIHAAAEHPEDPQRFIDDHIVPFDDPVAGLQWSADAPGGLGDDLTEDELSWLDVALWRRMIANPGTGNMNREQADGYLTALAAGPVRVPAADALQLIWDAETKSPLFDTPEHDTYVTQLLTRHFEQIERILANGESIEPWIDYDLLPDEYVAVLWARGYAIGVEEHHDAWQSLLRTKRLADRLMVPLAVLVHNHEAPRNERMQSRERSELVQLLPDIVAATWSFWHGEEHPLIAAPRGRAQKVGRNDPCPCGSGKKYKRCCGAAA